MDNGKIEVVAQSVDGGDPDMHTHVFECDCGIDAEMIEAEYIKWRCNDCGHDEEIPSFGVPFNGTMVILKEKPFYADSLRGHKRPEIIDEKPIDKETFFSIISGNYGVLLVEAEYGN